MHPTWTPTTPDTATQWGKPTTTPPENPSQPTLESETK